MIEDSAMLTRRAFLQAAAFGSAVAASFSPRARAATGDQSMDLSADDLAHVRAIAAAFMTKYDVPGLSIAVAKNGTPEFALAFGVADKARHEALTDTHLFRIASVSKPFTSATIFALIEAGKLSAADRVFGPGAVLGTDFGGPPYKPHVADLTIHHLLTHSAGGWQNDGTDPMFSNPRMNQKQLIGWTIQNLPISNPPGTHYAYSNFGYCVLGRVIEKLTQRPYADAVRAIVFEPCGIDGMRIAGNTLADRAPHEVVYYGQDNEDPYRMQVARMDSHGGWLASPRDLVKFLTHVDGFPRPPDILSPSSIAAMTMPSEANAGYASGWAVNAEHNWWHNGSLPGTTTIMVRTSGGFCWAALTNTRRPNSSIGLDLDHMMWDVVRAVSAWPRTSSSL